MITANVFKENFYASFASVRESEGDFHVSRRSHYMLWDKASVIQRTAERLGLCVARGEPLRLDAVFVGREDVDSHRRLPMLVALEHENNPWTIEQEFRVLFSVRAPLKVAITYFQSEDNAKSVHFDKFFKTKLYDEWNKANAISSENEHTEYLVLVGADKGGEDIFGWKSLVFGAAGGPQNIDFI